MSSAEFYLRCWLHPGDGTIQKEIYHHGFLPIVGENKRSVEEWVEEHIDLLNLYEEFDLDDEKCWQVIATGSIHGEFDYWGEYGEEIEFSYVKTLEVSEADIDMREGRHRE